MTIVMGVDQHRGQITGEWIDTETAEVRRARVAPADRAAVREFLARFQGAMLEATTGWSFVVEELRSVGAVVHSPSRRRPLTSAGPRTGRRATATTPDICGSC